MKKIILLSLSFLILSNSQAVETSDGFVVTAYDDRFRVVSPLKFRTPMEVIIENKTLVRGIGKVVLNNKLTVALTSVDPDKYQRVMVNFKKGDFLHFVPLSPSFQEVELIIGNKIYEIPPKR